MKISRPVAFGMGAVMALVIGSGTAFAATGGKFILGKSNSAGATSTLTNSRGTALTLNSKAGTPSLRVNRTTKVPNLNSDLLDGLDQSRFALVAGQTNTISDSGLVVPADPDAGTPAFIAAQVSCPAGTQMTGGGGEDDTSGGTLWLSAPGVVRNTWVVASTQTTASQENADSLWVFVQCYNSRGAVPGGELRAAPINLGKNLTALKAKAAKKLG
jgi:hypothetical protein